MGLGFFLFGIKFLSQYFPEIFDKKVREKIQSWTKTPLLCFFTGALLITISQSVTALLVILFGMIRSNAISKEKAIYVVIGAIDQEVDALVNRELFSQVEYLRVNNILIKQHIIDQCHETLLLLSTALLKLRKNKEFNHFYDVVVESVDIVSLILLDIVKTHDVKDFEVLKKITTSKGAGIAKLRELYLKVDNLISPEKRCELLTAINQCEVIVFLFLDLARKYVIEKLNPQKTA